MDKYFWKNEPKSKRNYDIEDFLFEKIKKATEKYDASSSDILNACIKSMLKADTLDITKVTENEFYGPHTFYVLESNIVGLTKLNTLYGISIRRLVNLAILNYLE